MLSLPELSAIAQALTPLITGARLQRIAQTNEHALYLELYAHDDEADSAAKHAVLLSCHPQFARIELAEKMPKAPQWPPDFAAFLKARLARARFKGLRLHNEDRLLGLLFEGKETGVEILLSLMGARSNIYALDLDGKVLASMRPLSTTRNELHIGQPWVDPEKRNEPTVRNRWASLKGAELLEAARQHYAGMEDEASYDRLKSGLHTAVKRELDFAIRKEANLQRDLKDAKDARENKRLGELLKSVMPQINPGDSKAVARDFETGEEVEIALDPALSPSENLVRFFKNYHKGLVGANMLGQQLEITQSHVSDLRELMAELEAIADTGALALFAERPAVANLRKKHAPEETTRTRPPKKKPAKKEVPSRLLPRRYRTSDGLEVWVGRSDEGNDYLTTKLANGNDLFFHVEGYPGSHTILRVDGKKAPPSESLLEAGELAVQFSKMKDATKATLHIAPIKDVHKPKGAKPGLVYVNKGKTMQLRRDKKRLERVMAALIKE